MVQVCVPSIHKATNNNRFLNKKDKQKKQHRLVDDKKKDVVKLHTIGITKKKPFSVPELKELIKDFIYQTGEIPTTIEHPVGCDGDSTTIWFEDVGRTICINWKYGKVFSIY